MPPGRGRTEASRLCLCLDSTLPRAVPSSLESPSRPLRKHCGSAIQHRRHATWASDWLCSALAVPSRTKGLTALASSVKWGPCCTRLCRALDGGLPRDMSTSHPPEPVNVTLFGRGSPQIFFKLKNLRSSWITLVSPQPNDKCPYERWKRRQGEEERPREDRGRARSDVTTRRAGTSGHRKRQASRQCRANTLLLDSWTWSWERIHFCCFKPPGLWSFIMAQAVRLTGSA